MRQTPEHSFQQQVKVFCTDPKYSTFGVTSNRYLIGPMTFTPDRGFTSTLAPAQIPEPLKEMLGLQGTRVSQSITFLAEWVTPETDLIPLESPIEDAFDRWHNPGYHMTEYYVPGRATVFARSDSRGMSAMLTEPVDPWKRLRTIGVQRIVAQQSTNLSEKIEPNLSVEQLQQLRVATMELLILQADQELRAHGLQQPTHPGILQTIKSRLGIRGD